MSVEFEELAKLRENPAEDFTSMLITELHTYYSLVIYLVDSFIVIMRIITCILLFN